MAVAARQHLNVRIPAELANRLERHLERSGQTKTSAVLSALDALLTPSEAPTTPKRLEKLEAAVKTLWETVYAEPRDD